MTTLQQQAESDSAPWLIANRNAETLSAAGIFGKRQSATSGLTWAYYGGLYNGNTIADGTVTLTNAATNYVVVLRSTGVVSTSTSSTNSLDPLYAKLYTLTTAGSVVTAELDSRWDSNGLLFQTGGGVAIDAIWDAVGDLIVGTGPNTAARLAAGTNGHVLTLAAGTPAWQAAASGAVATDTIWDAVGDLVVGTGANTAARLAAGTNGHVLTLAAGTPAWQAPSGGGGTKTYAVLSPMDSQPPAANFATLDTRNSIAVLEFDASTDESALWVWGVPEGASLGSGLIVRITWMADSATTGTCRWGVQIERMNTDLDADSFDTAATGGSATNATSGIATVTAITITTIDSIVAGDGFRLKVYRDADGTSGTDDMAGDAQLIAVEVRSAA